MYILPHNCTISYCTVPQHQCTHTYKSIPPHHHVIFTLLYCPIIVLSVSVQYCPITVILSRFKGTNLSMFLTTVFIRQYILNSLFQQYLTRNCTFFGNCAIYSTVIVSFKFNYKILILQAVMVLNHCTLLYSAAEWYSGTVVQWYSGTVQQSGSIFPSLYHHYHTGPYCPTLTHTLTPLYSLLSFLCGGNSIFVYFLFLELISLIIVSQEYSVVFSFVSFLPSPTLFFRGSYETLLFPKILLSMTSQYIFIVSNLYF